MAEKLLSVQHDTNKHSAASMATVTRSSNAIITNGFARLAEQLRQRYENDGVRLPEVDRRRTISRKKPSLDGALQALDMEIGREEQERRALFQNTQIVGQDLADRLAAIGQRIAALKDRKAAVRAGVDEFDRELARADAHARGALEALAASARAEIVAENAQAKERLMQQLLERVGDILDELATIEISVNACSNLAPFQQAIEKILRGEAAPVVAAAAGV
jgi:hypothetical protein